MINQKVLEINYPVDITSYEYQKNYYHHCYGLNEFEFIAQAMMTLGGGFNYDKKKGAFINDRAKYIENLKEAPSTREQPVKNFNYLYPTDITYLNKDWLDAIKYAVDVLKNDRPIPMVFTKTDVNESLNSAIEYYENKKIEFNNSLKPKM